jgi:hypothetical protein
MPFLKQTLARGLFSADLKNFLLSAILALLSTQADAQALSPTPRIKILLLGSSHFTPSTSDVNKTAAVDLTTVSRQLQVQAVVQKLVAFHPQQLFVEQSVARQSQLDSLYQAYQQGRYVLRSSELDQIGFQTARQLQLLRLGAVNYPSKMAGDPVIAYAQQHGQQAILAGLDAQGKALTAEQDQRGQELPLKEYLIYLNTPASLNNNAAFYTQYLVRIGAGKEYPGVDLVSDWYATNLHIYANILRQVKPTDKAVLLLFGQGHIPILKALFASNPAFEVVEVATVLKYFR